MNVKRIWSILTAVLISLTACSTQKHYRTLSFFFDGVPLPDDKVLVSDTDSIQTVFPDSLSINSQATGLNMHVHQPYREKECVACHNQGRMGSLNMKQPELCYQCHINFRLKYQIEHGPIAGGHCSKCHNPHRFKDANLLVREGEDICLLCHQATAVAENLFHNIVEESNCIKCHNPHGGNNYSFLQQGACYKCHENFTDNYSRVHGPVAAEICSVCHTTHREDSEDNLIKSGQELCFNCHNTERLINNINHPSIGDTYCIECHNPHASEKRFLIY